MCSKSSKDPDAKLYIHLFSLKELCVTGHLNSLVHVLYVTMGIWPPVVCGVHVDSVNDSESPYPVLDRKTHHKWIRRCQICIKSVVNLNFYYVITVILFYFVSRL